MPGLMEPSERMTAGVLFSSTAASVPTGGLSQATTAMRPATPFAARWTSATSWTSSRPIRENRICGVPLSWPSDTPEGERRRDQPDRQVVLGDAPVEGGLDGLHLLR